MKRFIPDTIFSRLFVLVFAAVFISHAITFALLVGLFDYRPHPTIPTDAPPPGLWAGFTIQFFTLSIAAWFGAKILAQPMALRRCLSNLVDNALGYGGNAKIALCDSPQTLVIEVADDGPGIPEEKMQDVFEPFVRLESSRNKAFAGVGLGLSIAREAASQCGGNLTLRNAEGGGLIACVSISRYR